MAEKEPVSLDALNGLLKERQRYEEWLAALEAKRTGTSDSVYQRVQADYQTRLREVSGKLAERAGELRENIDALTLKLEDVTRQETQQREARQEAELRAAVGEYTDKQWKEIGGAWDKELARLVKDKNALDAQLVELNRIFALSIKEKQSAAAMERSGPQSPAVPDRSASQDGARAPISPVVPRPAIPEPPTLNPPSRIEPATAARTSAPTPSAPPGNSRSPFDEFPVLRPNPGPGAPPSGTTAVATPPSVPKSGGPQDPRSEQHKTLKCPECGAANYPTEWYCERCGGELATM
jgi:TolA-binding protein